MNKISHTSTHSLLADSRHDDTPWWVGSCGTSWDHIAPCCCCPQRWWGLFVSRTGLKEDSGTGRVLSILHRMKNITSMNEPNTLTLIKKAVVMIRLSDACCNVWWHVAQWLALVPHSQKVLGSRPLPSGCFSTLTWVLWFPPLHNT